MRIWFTDENGKRRLHFIRNVTAGPANPWRDRRFLAAMAVLLLTGGIVRALGQSTLLFYAGIWLGLEFAKRFDRKP